MTIQTGTAPLTTPASLSALLAFHARPSGYRFAVATLRGSWSASARVRGMGERA